MKENPGEIKQGFTPLQRFFIAYAFTWAENCCDEMVLQMVKSDEHSPSRLRVNGVLSHIDEWYEAFGITEEHSMYIAPEAHSAQLYIYPACPFDIFSGHKDMILFSEINAFFRK